VPQGYYLLMISMVEGTSDQPMRQLLSKYFPELTFSDDNITARSGDYRPSLVDEETKEETAQTEPLEEIMFAVMYTQKSERITNLPEIDNLIWLHEAYFDLDLDVYFNEADAIFKKLHPDGDLL